MKTALLVIDIIKDCCHPDAETENITFRKIRKMVPRLKKFIESYSGPVIYIKCTPWTKEYLPENIKELYKDPKCTYYSKPEFAEFYEIEPKGSIITKNTYDAFSNPELDKQLKQKQITHLIITGVFGDACVMSTISSAFSKGYSLIILKDLIETTDNKKRQKLQRLLKEYTWPIMFGRTIESTDLYQATQHD